MLCTLQKLSMASAGEQPPQANENSGNILSSPEKNNIRITFYTGHRARLCSFLRDLLLMALAMQIVNDNTADTGHFNYDRSEALLHVIKRKCGDRKWNSIERNFINILKLTKKLPKRDLQDNITSFNDICGIAEKIFKQLSGKRQQKRNEQMFLVKTKIKHRCTETDFQIQESLLFKDAVDDIKDALKVMNRENRYHHFRDTCQRIRVAAMHGICISLRARWNVFQDAEVSGIIFHEAEVLVKNTPLTPFDLIEYLYRDRDQAVHPSETGGGQGNIDCFLEQFNYIDWNLKEYFKDTDGMTVEDRRKYLKYLFPKYFDSRDDMDKTYTETRECYHNFQRIMMMEQSEDISPVEESVALTTIQVTDDDKLNDDDVKDLRVMLTTAARIEMSTHVLECLVMILSVTIVNNSTSFGVLNYQEVKHALRTAKRRCTKNNREFDTRELSVLRLLESLELFDKRNLNPGYVSPADLEVQIVHRTAEVLDQRQLVNIGAPPRQCQSIVTYDRWKTRNSSLFTKAATQFSCPQNPLLSLQEDKRNYVLQRLKVAAVHEICVSLGVGWTLFHAINCGYLFCDNLQKFCDTAQGSLNAYQVMSYLSNSRHHSAHYHTLPEGESNINTFLHQYDAMIAIMNPYFQYDDVQQVYYAWRNKYLRYLFPEIIQNRVDIGWRLAKCYPNLEYMIDDRIRLKGAKKDLDQQVTDLSEREQKQKQKITDLKEAAVPVQGHSSSLQAIDVQPIEDLQAHNAVDETNTVDIERHESDDAQTEASHCLPTDYTSSLKDDEPNIEKVRKILADFSGLFVRGPLCRMTISRSNVWKSAEQFWRLPTLAGRCGEMVIKFGDGGEVEPSVDQGGPRREFFRLLLEEIKNNSGIFSTDDHGHSHLVLDDGHLNNSTYQMIGEMMAAMVAQGGPLPTLLDSTAVRYLMDPRVEVKVDIDDLPRKEACILNQMKSAKQEELREFVAQLESFNGLPTDVTNENKQQFIDLFTETKLLIRRKAHLDSLAVGLNLYGLLNMLRTEKIGEFVLCRDNKVNPLTTMDCVMNQFEVCWSTSQKEKSDEEKVLSHLKDTLKMCEDNKLGEKIHQMEKVDMDGVTQNLDDHKRLRDLCDSLKPIDFLIYASGANSIPSTGWPTNPKIAFSHNVNGSHICVSTCNLIVTIPVTETNMDLEGFMFCFISSLSHAGAFSEI